MKKECVLIIILFISVSGTANAQKRAEKLSGDKILGKVVKGFADVHDFTATIDAAINMERMQVPKMHAIMYSKRPDKIHFSSQGFMLIPRDGIALNPAVLSERYDASLAGTDTAGGRKMYKLQLAAKETKTKLRQMYAWIDPVQWTVVKIETIPYEGRTLSIGFVYEFVENKFWLPSKTVVSFGSVGETEKGTEDTVSHSGGQFPQMQSSVPRNGSVTILYSDYKINIGIDDSVFEEKKQ